jgi:flagellar biosynthesis protein FliR
MTPMQQLMEFILAQTPTAMLSIARVSGLAIYGPLLGSPAIPMKIRALLIAAIGLACCAAIPTASVDLSIASIAPCIAAEFTIGLVIGFVASMPMVTAQLAGLVTGQQLGLGFALIYNPAADTEADALGQMLFFMTLAMFIAIGGVESTFLALLESYKHIPAGCFIPDLNLLELVTGLLLASMEVALRVAAPLLAIVFLETVTMGFLAKTVPQLSLLNIGFPLRIILGLAILATGLTVIHDVMMDDAASTMAAITTFLEQR